MSTIPQIRKNIKFFANGKNKPLVQLATMVADTEVVLAVLPVNQPSEFNTCLKVRRDLYPLLPIESTEYNFDMRYRERNIMYDRIDLVEAFVIEFVASENGSFVIDKDTKYDQPMSLEKVIEILNNKFGYDITTDDITITYTSGVNYTITARPNSLQFTGQVSVDIGTEEEVPPPEKIPSHDSVWDDTLINHSAPISVNGNDVNTKDLAALHTAGIALVQFADPNMAWLVWTGKLPGEASFRTTSPAPKIASANVNQTLKITDGNLFAKYVPFTPNKTIPNFTNTVVVSNFKQTMFFTVPYALTLDRMVTVWIDDVETTFTDLLKPAGVNGFKLVLASNGDASLEHDGIKTQKVQMRVNVATIPALVRSNSRFIYGIQRGGNNIPLDSFGHEVYNLSFPKREIVQPDPSTITPVIPGNAQDYIAALNKVASGLILPFDAYRATSPTISTLTGGRLQLSATVESETNESRFPAFYFIKEKDWLVIAAQPINTKLGTYTLSSTNPFTFDITVGTLLGAVVPVSGGRMFCMVSDIPLHANGQFVLDYDPNGIAYSNTTTLLRFDITYSKASFIAPKQMDYNILRTIANRTMTSTAIDNMVVRQSEVQRFINQISSQWYANYEFAPYNPPGTLEPSMDDNGKFVLQLMAIPSVAMAQIQDIAAREPTAVILRLTDTGHVNDVTLTAMEITQQAVIQSGTGDGYLCFKHSKSSSNSSVRWTFVCDYDGEDLKYRETTTIVNITDSVIDEPGIPFAGVGIQECSNLTQYDNFVGKVNEDFPNVFYTWGQHDLLIDVTSTQGTFVKYGVDTPEKHTVGRLLLHSQQTDWLANGDFDQFPVKDPVIIKATNSTTGEYFEVNLSYLRKHARNTGGIPILLPYFDDQERTNQWSYAIKFFGYGNPERPAPSPLPNLEDGTVNIAVKCTIKPFREFASLFNYTSNVTTQEKSVMRNNLINQGFDVTPTDTIVTSYSVNVSGDVTTPPPGYGRNVENITVDISKQTPTWNIVRYISIDPTLMGLFLSATYTQEQLNKVIFKRTTDSNPLEQPQTSITLDMIRKTGILTTSQGLIPVVGAMSAIVEYGNPALPMHEWAADFSVLDGNGNIYTERKVQLTGSIHSNSGKKPTIELYGTRGHTYPAGTDLMTLATKQWPGYSYSLLDDLDITANKTFGTWNVNFLNKGKFGFEVFEFSDDALTVLNSAVALGIKTNVFSLSVTSVDAYNFNTNFTAVKLLEALDGGKYLTVPIKAAMIRGDYDININSSFDIDGTTTSFPPMAINNVTRVKDGTPPDVTVDARWTLPVDQAELDLWCGAVGLSSVSKADYGMTVTQFHYTHNVIVEQSGVEYVAAIAIDKTVRERLIENQYPDSTIVGLFNGTDILASDLIDGLQNAAGDNIILVRAAINLAENRFGLSFSVSGIADYSKIFTGKDVPVVQASDVLVTAIQNDFGQVIDNLRNALNPLADTVINPVDITNKTISESNTTIINQLNELTRDNVGKTWVIPIGINKKQLANLVPGSWLVIRCTSGLELTVNTTDLQQKVDEGWTYKLGETEYAIYPILTVITNRDDVFKQTFSLAAGMSVGRWAPWFTNFNRQVNLEYSILTAKQTIAEVLVPYDDGAALKASGAFQPFMDVDKFVKLSGNVELIPGLGPIPTSMFSYGTGIQVGNSFPLFVRFNVQQVDSLPSNDAILGSVKLDTVRWPEGPPEIVDTLTTTYTKADIIAGVKIGNWYYRLVGRTYTSALDTAQLATATFDYDDTEDNWLSVTSVYSAGLEQIYPIACVGAVPFAGTLSINFDDVEDILNSTLVNYEGDIVQVVNEAEFASALENDFGFQVTKLTRFGD